MAKQYIDVLIDGKVYSLGGSETEGYVQQIATYLNGKIFQLKAQPGFFHKKPPLPLQSTPPLAPQKPRRVCRPQAAKK